MNGYDPEALMQQYRDWEGQQWQPPTWGQPPLTWEGQPWSQQPLTWQTLPGDPNIPPPGTYIPEWKGPIETSWQMSSPGIQATGIPGAQTTQIPALTPEGPVRAPSWGKWKPWLDPVLTAREWKSAAPSPWQAMEDQARYLLGAQREAVKAFKETPSWQTGAGLLGSSMGMLGGFPTVPWAGVERGISKLKEFTAGPEGEQFFQDLLRDTPFTEEAKSFFDKELDIGITELLSQEGGGAYRGAGQTATAYLRTANYTTAIHELAHAWWNPKRLEEKDAFIEAMTRFADESKQYQYKTPAMERAILSIYGEPDPPYYSQGARISENEWNDQEMYAYMSEFVTRDIDAVPPYLRQFYEGLFTASPEPEWGYSSLWPEERALATQKRRDSAMRKQP